MVDPSLEPIIDPAAELSGLGTTLEDFAALHRDLGARAGAHAASVSGWSVEQHLYHLALASDLALRHVRSLLDGKGALVRAEGRLEPATAQVLTGERAERGVAEAPRMVRPPDEVQAEYLEMELEGLRKAIHALEPRTPEVLGAPDWIPHQELGTLQASHWLCFAHLHARHHLEIARDVASGLEAPGQP